MNHQQWLVAAHSDAVAVVHTLVVVELLQAVNLSCDDNIIELIKIVIPEHNEGKLKTFLENYKYSRNIEKKF